MDSVSACLFSSLSFMFLPQYFLCFILVCILFDFSFPLFNSVFNYLTTDFLFCHISVDSVIRVSSLTSGSLGWIIAPFATALGSLLGSAVSHLESSGMSHSLILSSWITHGGPAGQRVWAHVNPNKTTWAGRNAESWGPATVRNFSFSVFFYPSLAAVSRGILLLWRVTLTSSYWNSSSMYHTVIHRAPWSPVTSVFLLSWWKLLTGPQLDDVHLNLAAKTLQLLDSSSCRNNCDVQALLRCLLAKVMFLHLHLFWSNHCMHYVY